jgi:non-canonical poly(A) RNA polymerase PAPD5/7
VAARRAVVADTQRAIQEVLGSGYSIELFGSERTGVALATSDIDLSLSSISLGQKNKKSPAQTTRRANLQGLQKLADALRKNPECRDVAVQYARYPLVCFTHEKSGIDVQIVAGNDTSKSQAIMRNYMETCPGLVEIFSLIKTAFDVRGLSKVYDGGMGSYSLFMLVVANMKLFAQQHPEQSAPPLSKRLKTLLHIRKMVNFQHHGISVEPAGLFKKKPNVRPPGKTPSTRKFNHPEEVRTQL